MKETVSNLGACPLFRQIPEESYEEVLTGLSAQTRRCRKNEAVWLTGDPVTALGIVLSGSVQVVKEDFLGNRTILAQIGPGGLFGESFCCAGIEKLPVSVFSATDSELLFLDMQKAMDEVHPVPCKGLLVRNMVGILAGKNVYLNGKIEVLARRSTREKLIAYLSEQARLAGSPSFQLPFNRQELADYLCVDRSAMSTELGKLRDEGLLTFRRNAFQLHFNQ